MLNSKKLLFLFTILAISQQYQAKEDLGERFDKWEQKHRERKAKHAQEKAKKEARKARSK